MDTPLAFLGIPSIDEIVSKIASGIFKALADALIPDWLKDAGGQFFTWLVNVPNPANASRMPNLDILHDHVMWLAIALLGLTSVMAAVRYTIGAMTADENPVSAWFRTVYAAAGLMLYQWAFVNAIAFVNVMTAQIFAWPIVKQGMHALGASVFNAAVFTPQAAPILSIFAIIAFVIVVVLIATKLAIFMVLSMLYVGGPLAIALSPVPEFSGIVRTWAQSVAAVLMVPLMWTLMFATAGVFVKDMPRAIGLVAGSGVASKIGAGFVSALAALILVFLAMKVGTKGLSHVTQTLSGFLAHGSSGTRLSGVISGAAIGEGRARLRAGMRGQAGGAAASHGSRRAALAAVTAAAGGAGAASAARAGAGADSAARHARAASDANSRVQSDQGKGANGSDPGTQRKRDGSTEPARDRRSGAPAVPASATHLPNGGPGAKNASRTPRAHSVPPPGAADKAPSPSTPRSKNGVAQGAPTSVAPTTRRPVGAPPVANGNTPAKKPAVAPKKRIEEAGAKAGAKAKAVAKRRSDAPAQSPAKAPRSTARGGRRGGGTR